MRAIVCVVASATVLVMGAAPVVRTQTPAMDARPVLTQYRFTCHNDRLKTGGLSLEALDLAKIGDSPDVWEKVVRRLRTGAMPPPSARRPDQATYDRLTGWLEKELDSHAAAHPNPGRPAVHRLNRSEYAERDPRPAGAGRERRVAPAAGRLRVRVRQRRRRARRVAGAARAVSERGGRDQRAGRRATRTPAPARRATTSATICRRISTSTACRSAPSAARSSATLFRSTPRTSSRSSCSAPT